MARVTVEDCVEVVPNRFDLVTLASQRAKQIAAGNPITVTRDNDKDPVVALREIADKTVAVTQLMEEMIQHFCKRHATEAASSETAAEQTDSEVQEAFQDARQNIAVLDGKMMGKPTDMSFVDENVTAED